MIRVILADNQGIFRAGAARVLATEEDMRIVAQCDDAGRALQAITSMRSSVVLLALSIELNLNQAFAAATYSGSRVVLLVEPEDEVPEHVSARLDGLLTRNVASAGLLDCVRRVSRGERSVHKMASAVISPDSVGLRVRERLTARELQIVRYIVQGCKNRQIADELGTKEQVVKNYLRSIYDKTGVSDRLELALFTLHHRVLADGASPNPEQ